MLKTITASFVFGVAVLISGSNNNSSNRLLFVNGQGCSNTCPPINFGLPVPSLCEGDVVDEGDTAVDITRQHDICYPKVSLGDGITSSITTNKFSLQNQRRTTGGDGSSRHVTVIASYYTGCNAGRRESGVFAHTAQRLYNEYGPEKVTFVQTVRGGGTCQQWASIYQRDAVILFPDSGVVPNEMPLSIADTDFVIRDELFTTPFGHPSYVIMDQDLMIHHKFIGPCCGYEAYSDCTPDIARTLDGNLTQMVEALLMMEGDEEEQEVGPAQEEDDTTTEPVQEVGGNNETNVDCSLLEFTDWSACSIRCGMTEGMRFRYRGGTNTNCPIETEIEPCFAANSENCNVEDGGTACVPEFGESFTINTIVDDLNNPRDVKFHPSPGLHLGPRSEGRTFAVGVGDEAWILNGNNHSVSIISAIGTEYQTSFSRRDRGYFHYQVRVTHENNIICR
jgi:hypothetical protein